MSTICFPSVTSAQAPFYSARNTGANPTGFDYPMPSYVPDGGYGNSPALDILYAANLAARKYTSGPGLFIPLLSTIGQCYVEAAHDSALQMGIERNQRLAAAGKPTLTSSDQATWFSGSTGYMGDFALSLQQLIHDDITASDSSKVFEPLKSPDGILPYTPGRLAQANLTDTYHALMGTEENALAVLAQSQSPETVAKISTTETVTDPIGRLTTGALVQNQLTGALVNPLAPTLVSNPGVPANITAGTAGAGAAAPPAGTPAAAPATSNATPLIGLAIALIPFFLPGNK